MSNEIKKLVTIISAESQVDIPKRAGGTYPGALLAYKADGQVSQKGIHSTVLGNNAELTAQIKELEGKTNVDVTLHMIKNDNGFWDLVEILPADQAVKGGFGGGGGSSSFGKRGSSSSSKPTGEVARIARQNALDAAVRVTSTAEEALKVASAFADFILAPLGVDNAGEAVSTTEVVEKKETKSDTPF